MMIPFPHFLIILDTAIPLSMIPDDFLEDLTDDPFNPIPGAAAAVNHLVNSTIADAIDEELFYKGSDPEYRDPDLVPRRDYAAMRASVTGDPGLRQDPRVYHDALKYIDRLEAREDLDIRLARTRYFADLEQAQRPRFTSQPSVPADTTEEPAYAMAQDTLLNYKDYTYKRWSYLRKNGISVVRGPRNGPRPVVGFQLDPLHIAPSDNPWFVRDIHTTFFAHMRDRALSGGDIFTLEAPAHRHSIRSYSYWDRVLSYFLQFF